MGRYEVARGKAHPPHTAVVSVMEHEGRLFVTHADLLAAGYKFLEDFTIVRLNGKFYELQAHFGKNDPDFIGGAWWIEEIDPEAHFADVETTTTEKQLSLF